MDAVGLQRAKEGIIHHISTNGPSLPASIASQLKVPLLFISAFLSELYREEKLMMSHMKIGTSSLYLLPGQEKDLEKFIQHLNQREREALSILRSKKILKDSELSPVHRVAIREIKDFALPVQKNNELTWEYAFADKTQEVEIKKEILEEKKVEIKENIEEKLKEDNNEIKIKKTKPKKVQKIVEPFSLSLSNAELNTPLSDEVKLFLEKNNYLIQNLVKADKKECIFKASINGPHGEQSYLVHACNKKKLKEEELTSILKDAHNQRLLALVLARAEPDKKTLSFIKNWNNFLAYKVF